MRVTLIQPPQGSRFGFTKVLLVEPLGLEYVAAAIKLHEHVVQIIDLRLESPSFLREHLRSFRPGAVGISCGFTTDVYSSLTTAGVVRNLMPDAIIFAGGHHASLLPGDLLFAGSPVDAVVVGEGEWAGLDLVDALERGQDPGGVPGVLTHDNRDHGYQPRSQVESLDALPLPDRYLTRRYRHCYHHGFSVPSACIETSRGCPFNCSFCSIWVFYQRRIRHRSADRIVEELEQIQALGEDHVFITDDIAFLHHGAYEELGCAIREARLEKHYTAETRADLVVKHQDLFELWKDIGMDTVFLGVEKFDDRGLDSVRKRTKGGARTNLEAIATLRRLGITPMTSLIVDPDWDEEDFDMLEHTVRELMLPNPAFTVLTPLPGTELWEQTKTKITTYDYGYFDVMHLVLPSTLEPARFYQRLARLYDLADIRTRLSWRAIGNLAKMGAMGHARIVGRVFGAVRDMRDPRAYLGYPGTVHKPDFLPEGFGSLSWIDTSRSDLSLRVARHAQA